MDKEKKIEKYPTLKIKLPTELSPLATREESPDSIEQFTGEQPAVC